jgi:beta-glucosidase
MYPFGFGLSYSQFKYYDLNLSDDVFHIGKTMTVNLKVENISDKHAEEVVQMYVTQPESDHNNSKFTLKQFKRIFLSPGEKKIITFSLTPQMLESFDINGNSKIEMGTYKITIGNSSPGARSKQLGATLLSAEFDAI